MAGASMVGGLRQAVLAGPGVAGVVDDGVAGSVLDLLADRAVIAAGLVAAGHVDKRRRALPGMVMVVAVLALCLFRRENADLVLARVPWVGAPGDAAPTAQALSGARARLVGEPVQPVPLGKSVTATPPGSRVAGRVLTARLPQIPA
jgi:hypothetical protein